MTTTKGRNSDNIIYLVCVHYCKLEYRRTEFYELVYIVNTIILLSFWISY
jgi:hypothetical protein